ncbi:hypothetical protein O6H91_15G086700 [Diphasiastrum complanatum]|uniref:Uncharacterized protein n=1 Tax=Diphasiastrum complanatum TaxID=34168 RepID=A0ACC2BKL5_DIPCM|nr:hypothetical protein O6H91_15G086700 [Diphasiastrum complanatum]
MARARIHKRTISDQQRRRDLALERQKECRRDLQQHARQLASSIADHHHPHYNLSNPDFQGLTDGSNEELSYGDEEESSSSSGHSEGVLGLLEGTRLRGSEAKAWYAQQFMLPEWMIDIPSHLKRDWYVMARPAGKRCLVISSSGTTFSRTRNGKLLHCFPSALPNGAKIRDVAAPSHVFCILDCIFHEPDSTYYILDVMCWRGYSLYDCSTEFRFFWRDSKLSEEKVFVPPSTYHRYRFCLVSVNECNEAGLQAAYCGPTSFQRDGVLLYNRHAHYVLGITPLALLWKDADCSQFPLDTDSKGHVPAHQQVVLRLQSDGTVVTGDDRPVVLGIMPEQFLSQKISSQAHEDGLMEDMRHSHFSRVPFFVL